MRRDLGWLLSLAAALVASGLGGCRPAAEEWSIELEPVLERAAFLPAGDLAWLRPERGRPAESAYDWWVARPAAPLAGWGLGLRGWRPLGDRAALRLWRSDPAADRLDLELWRRRPEPARQRVAVEWNGRRLGELMFGGRRAVGRLAVPPERLREANEVALTFDPPLAQPPAGRQEAGVARIGLVRAGARRKPSPAPRLDPDSGRVAVFASGRLVAPLDLPAGSRALELEARLRAAQGGPRPAAELAVELVDLAGEVLATGHLGGLGPEWSALRIELDAAEPAASGAGRGAPEPPPARRLLVIEAGVGGDAALELRAARLVGRGPRGGEAGDGGAKAASGAARSQTGESARRGAGRPPDVLLVVLDAARGDRFLGYTRDVIPNLGRVMREALVFERAYAECPTTVCSIPNLISGVPFAQVGDVFRGAKLADEVVTLAESLAAAGYTTVGFSATPNNSAARNTHQGFERFEQVWGPFEMSRLAAEVIAAQPAERPLFLQLHYLPPHQPYEPAPEHDLFTDPGYAGPIEPRMSLVPYSRGLEPLAAADLEQLVGLYDGNLRTGDAAVARVLEALRAAGRWDATLLLVTADHGEAFMEHGRQGHNTTLYDEMLHVPFVLRLPGGRRPEGVDTGRPVTLGDAVPTILGALGLPVPPEAAGLDLLAPAAGGGSPLSRLLFHRTSHPDSPWLAARTARWKAIVWPKANVQELYDLESDPGETRNLVGAERALFTGLALSIRRHLERLEGRREPGEAVVLSDEDRRALRALGYVD